MKQHVIAKAIERFLEDPEHDSGFMIGGFPTGQGKTYESCYAILEEKEKDPSFKALVITEQTKNVPKDTMQDIAVKEFGYSEQKFKDTVLCLESNLDSFCKNYRPSMKKPIRELFKNEDISERILNNALHYMSAWNDIKDKDNILPEYKTQIQEEFRNAEKEFRDCIRKCLKRFGDAETRLRKIHTDDLYSWIRELYPVVEFDSHDIVLLSDAKFLLTLDTLVAAPFTIWLETDLRVNKETHEEHSRLTERVIFVDESDTFKGVIQNVLIEQKNDGVDTIRAFRNLYLRLQRAHNLPVIALTESKWWSGIKHSSIMERITKLKKSTAEMYTRNKMEHLFKQYGEDADGNPVEATGSAFMFSDYEPHCIGTAYTVKGDSQSRYNRIITGTAMRASSSNITRLFSNINEIFNQFCKLVRDLAVNYMYLKNESGGDLEECSFTNCVDTIIDAFDLESDFAEFVKSKVIHNRLKSGTEKKQAVNDPVVYSRGFYYISIRDSDRHQLQSRLYYTEHDVTPEAVLRNMAEKTKVVLLSATAGFGSPICNFNTDYLVDGGVYEHKLNEEEVADIQKSIDNNSYGFRNGRAELHCEVLPKVGDYSRYSWEGMFDEFTAEDIYNEIARASSGDAYPGPRYVRAAQAFERFLDHDDIGSMIAFFTAQPKSLNDSKFSTFVLQMILEKMAEKRGICIKVQWENDEVILLNKEAGEPSASIVQINGANFDRRKANVIKRLSGYTDEDGAYHEAEKILIVTAYATLGAGQNLQHGISRGLQDAIKWVREVSDYSYFKNEKDFDAIYLDDPTSIGPVIDFEKKDSLDNYLFYAEYLDSTGQISLADKKTEITNAFAQCYNYGRNRNPSHFQNTVAYKLAKARIINQAVGRMCRTGKKREHTYIFADSQLVTNGTFALDREDYGEFLSYEFTMLYDTIHAKSQIETEDRDYMDEAVRRSHAFVSYIDDLRFSVYGGEPEYITKWKELREFVTQHPTCPKEMDGLTKFQKLIHRYAYFEVPKKTNKYHFSLKYDFDQNGTDGLDISVDGPLPPKNKGELDKQWFCADEATSKLDLLYTIDCVREEFIRCGIPEKFKEDEMLMVAPAFRNIFMGGIGEISGKRILEDELKMELGDMPEGIYEMFDFRLDDNHFVDLKDWNERCETDEMKSRKAVEKIVRKLDRVHDVIDHSEGRIEKYVPKTVYVINVVVDGSVEYAPYETISTEKGDTIITIPYLYVSKNGKVSKNDKAIRMMKEGMGIE